MSQKINTPSFRTAIRGYNKDDINTYIKELNGSYVFASQDYQEKIHVLESSAAEREQVINKLRDELAECSSRPVEAQNSSFVKSVKTQNAETEVLIASLHARREEMLRCIQLLQKEKAQAEERAAAAENKIRRLESEASSQDDDSYDLNVLSKAEMYDKVSGQLGRILIDARENAEAILSEAKNQAAQIHAEADNMLRSASAEADRIRVEAQNDAKECRRNTEAYIRSIGETFAATSANVAVKVGKRYRELISEICIQFRGAADNAAAQSEELAGILEKDCVVELKDIADKTLRNAACESGIMTDGKISGSYNKKNEAADTQKKTKDTEDGTKNSAFGENNKESSAYKTGTVQKAEDRSAENDGFTKPSGILSRDDDITIDFGASD